ncbi:copper chaperone PCu(A)C [Polymorphospora sp. NPDC051019]|uniref:copper chaperone PCu(A)C n=1 Tax=Polymorphospora sp. NPDC051019 TaxID=3155725 RepID=UPI00343C5546
MARIPVPTRRPGSASRLGTGIAVLALLAVAACGTDDATAGDPEPSATPTAAAALTVRDPWVKVADSGMTSAFATLVNESATPVTVTGATSPVSPMELHEMAMRDGEMVMRAKPDGFTVPAGGSHVLEPGGDHLMLMALGRPVRAGDEVDITLTLADGGTVAFTALAKPFAGAQESYDPGHGGTPSPSGHAG